jgi:hypothetical protein
MDRRSAETTIHRRGTTHMLSSAHMHRAAANSSTAHVGAAHMHSAATKVLGSTHVHGSATHVHTAPAHMHATAATKMAATSTHVPTASAVSAATMTTTTAVGERQTRSRTQYCERNSPSKNEVSRHHHDLPVFSRVLCAGRPDDRKRTFEPLTDNRNLCFFAGCGE